MRAVFPLLLLFAACTLNTCTGGEAPAPEPAPSPSADEASDAPQAPLRFADLAAACDGDGEPRAATYPTTASEPPRLLVLVRDSLEAGYRDNTSDVYFRTWGIYSSSDYPDTEVVACVTGFPGAFLRACEFESSRDDSTYVLDLYAASYNVRLRAAQTGTLLEEFGLDATSDQCPMLHTFTGNGERERKLVGPPMDDLKDEVLARLAPDYDPRREFMDEDEIRVLDSLRSLIR